MSAPAPKVHKPKRAKYALTTALLLLGATVTGTLAIAVGERTATRIDATATRAHSLGERTLRAIENLAGPHELVLSADTSSLTANARAPLADLLDALGRSSPDLRVTIIDTREALAELVTRLADRDAARVILLREAIESASSDLINARGDLAELAANIQDGAGAMRTGRARFEAHAGALRRLAGELEPVESTLAGLARTPFAGVELPEADRALDSIAGPVERIVGALDALTADLAGLRTQAGQTPEERAISTWARSADTYANATRNAALRAFDVLRSEGPLEDPLDALTVARVLGAQEAALVVGPTGVVGVDVSAIVPPAGSSAADAAQLARSAEDAVATALASAAIESPPIVVLVHASDRRLIAPDGSIVPGAQQTLGAFADLLSRRRVSLAEWAPTTGEPMPTRAELDPTGTRPVVWFCPGPPALGASERYRKQVQLGAALARLASLGESMLLTLAPSDAPALGEDDPIASVATPFGIVARTGAPLIGVRSGQPVQLVHVSTRAGAGSPLAPAVDGLPTVISVPVPLEFIDPAPSGALAAPLLVYEPDPAIVWGESRWMSALADASQPPVFDPSADVSASSFTLAATAQRVRTASEPAPTIPGAQRLVVVTGQEWYTDAALNASDEVDGRSVLRFPGNRELIDASISYLAGYDALLPAQRRETDIARVRALTDGQITAVRFVLIAGLPLGVLILGGMWRVVRG